MKCCGKRAGGTAGMSGEQFAINRRQMLYGASMGTMFAALGAGGAWAASPLRHDEPVVSFHRDEPWIDKTGLARPYRPATGCRGGAPASQLGAEALHRLNCYL